MTHFNGLKYKQLASNTNDYFKHVRIVNLPNINHKCRGDLI